MAAEVGTEPVINGPSPTVGAGSVEDVAAGLADHAVAGLASGHGESSRRSLVQRDSLEAGPCGPGSVPDSGRGPRHGF